MGRLSTCVSCPRENHSRSTYTGGACNSEPSWCTKVLSKRSKMNQSGSTLTILAKVEESCGATRLTRAVDTPWKRRVGIVCDWGEWVSGWVGWVGMGWDE